MTTAVESIECVRGKVRDYKAKQFALENEIAGKMEIVRQIEEENGKIESENQSLLITYLNEVRVAKEEAKSASSCAVEIEQGFYFDCAVDNAKLKNDYFTLLEKYNNTKCLYKQTKKKHQRVVHKVKEADGEIKLYATLLVALKEEKNNLAESSYPDPYDEIVNENLSHLQLELKRKSDLLDKINEKYKSLENQYNRNEREYTLLSKKKFDLNMEIKTYQEKLELSIKNEKYLDNEFLITHTKIQKNKIVLEKIEENLNKSLYFIRFSNSLVRSFLNITNIRKLQIRMLKFMNKIEFCNYEHFFKKLDELETILITEYKAYLSLCE
jgi:DNA repair exonuclease SbcCD ATPase subunit